jgi:adenylyltransferase/sulfurtransferase
VTTLALIGAGGLGGPVAYALGAAGMHLRIIDPDQVELSNLQRQVQFTGADLGRRKVDALADELVRRGVPAAHIEPVAARFAAASAGDLLTGVDLAVEGSDDPATKFALNDAACARGLPLAIGGVERRRGQVIAARPGETGCYRCLFEAPPDPDQAPSCADAGVLGAAVAVVGGVLASAALGLAARDPEAAGLWLVDDAGARSQPRRVRYNPRSECPACRP